MAKQSIEHQLEAARTEHDRAYKEYENSVYLMLSLAYHLTWDAKGAACKTGTLAIQGPSMTDSTGNQRNPDLAVVLGKDVGIILEVKGSVSQHREHVQQVMRQFESYCTPLRGWPIKRFNGSSHIFIGLVPYAKKTVVSKELENMAKAGTFVPATPCLMASHTRESGPPDYYTFERFWAATTPSARSDLFLDVTQVPFSDVRIAFGAGVKFIDEKPPLPFLAVVFWDQLLPSMIKEKALDGQAGRKPIEIEVHVNQATERLNHAFSFNTILYKYGVNRAQTPSYSAIKADWVRELLQFMVRHKLATRKGARDLYIIRHRNLRPSTLDHFLKFVAVDGQIQRDRRQGIMFNEDI